jgi:PAS domain S-box-containing protein
MRSDHPHSNPAFSDAAPLLLAAPTVGVMRGYEGDITEADDAFLAIVGYTREEFIAGQMNWREMTPPEFLHLDEAGIRQAAESGGFTAPYQKQFVRKDGSRVPVLLVSAFIPDAPGKWVGYVVDLSAPVAQRAEAEVAHAPLAGPMPQEFYSRLVSELVRERTRMVAMLDSTDALVWAVDAQYRLRSANQAFHAAVRVDLGRDVQVGDDLLAIDGAADTRAQWAAWYDRALGGDHLATHSTRQIGGALRHYDHVLSPIFEPRRSGVVGVTVVSRDVSAQAEAEAALRASEARFRTLISASPLGILLTDPAGDCVYANPRVAATWQLPAAEMLGRGYMRHVHPDDASWVLAAWRAATDVGDELEAEYRLKPPRGGERHLRVRIAPVRDGPRITGYVGTVDDDTERRALAHRVRQSEKMESLGTLAGGIAHDFNNMLAVVLGYADLALEGAEGRPQLEADLSEIRTASLRARDLVQQILTFSRRGDREQAPVDLTALTAETVRLLRATVPTTIALEARLPDQPVVVLGDPSALQQVLVNLCTNAEHAMRGGAGGRLEVELAVDEGGETPRAVLTVSDTGHGMSAEVRERLFEPFFTTKPRGEGTGMGLAVVHGTVAAHDGAITVESEPGAGATFRVSLPLVQTGVAAPWAEGTPPRGSGRVLLAEDEPAVARFAARALTRAGYTVTCCRDGLEALRAFSAAPDAVDVLVTDVAMPGLTGDALARAVHAARPALPVVLVTGFSHTVTVDTARALGATLLQKPVSARDLARAVHAALPGPAGAP